MWVPRQSRTADLAFLARRLDVGQGRRAQLDPLRDLDRDGVKRVRVDPAVRHDPSEEAACESASNFEPSDRDDNGLQWRPILASDGVKVERRALSI